MAGLAVAKFGATVASSAGLSPATLDSNAGWTWFTDPRGRVVSGVLYFGFIRNNGNIIAATWNLTSGAFATFTLRTALEVDDHDNPSFVRRPDGKWLAFYCKHNDTTGMRIRLTTNADDFTAWDAEQSGLIANTNQGGGVGFSYSNPYYLGTRLILTARGNTFLPVITYSDDDGATWQASRNMFEAASSQRPYLKSASDGTNLHFFASTGHPRDVSAGACHLYHWYLRSSDWTFRKSDGTATGHSLASVLAGTVMPASAVTKIYDAGTAGNAWPMSFELDGAGNPVAAYAAYGVGDDPTDDDQYRYARWTGSAWDDHLIVSEGTGLYGAGSVTEPNYSGGATIDPRDTSKVIVARGIGGQMELERRVTADGGTNWTATQLTSGAANPRYRPYIPAGSPAWLTALYLEGVYTGYTNWNASLKAI